MKRIFPSLFFLFLLVFCVDFLALATTTETSQPDNSLQIIKPGMTVSELISQRGQPFYQTENFSHSSGDQVWLYTKKKTQKTVNENQERDTATQWLMLHRKTVTRSCEVGDVFVTISKEKVVAVKPANADIAYGSCVVETKDEVLPISAGQ